MSPVLPGGAAQQQHTSMAGAGGGHEREVQLHTGRRGVGGALLHPDKVRRLLSGCTSGSDPPDTPQPAQQQQQQQRSADDLDALVDHTRTLHFFRNVPVEHARAILAVAQLVKIPAGQLVQQRQHQHQHQHQRQCPPFSSTPSTPAQPSSIVFAGYQCREAEH
mmetsp:Transcript_17903/g.44370  ORF Transcript_17903/g.44370 Transcript_17903/m.44370 type:complete len:163 (+) Transcript_17903:75-563(+)